MAILPQQNFFAKSKFMLAIVMISVIVLPFADLLYAAFPINLFGKNTYVVIPVVSVIVVWLIGVLIIDARLKHFDVLLVAIVAISILLFLIRNVVYEEGTSYLDYRYIATSLIYFSLIVKLTRNKISALKVSVIAISGLGLIIALVEVVNVHFLPTTRLSYDNGVPEFIYDGESTRSMLLGASIMANQIVCSMFIIATLMKSNVLGINKLIYLSCLIFMTYAVWLGGSRYPQAVAIGIVIFSIYNKRYFSYQIVIVSAAIGCIFAALLLLGFPAESLGRFSEDSGGRVEKAILAIDILTGSNTNFLMGSSHYQLANGTNAGYEFSDNSYLLLALNFGVPFAILYFFALFYCLKRGIENKLSAYFFAYFIVGFGLTNCILWESWVMLVVFSFVIVASLNQLEKHENWWKNANAQEDYFKGG